MKSDKAKKTKPSIIRRKAGLIIEPPQPRPIESDHPALHFFKSATSETLKSSEEIVPEYRSTGGTQSQSDDKSSTLNNLNTRSNSGNTALPEYRSEHSRDVNNYTEAVVSPQTPATPHTRSLQPNSSVIPTSGFYRKTNAIADHVDRELTPAESKILDHLVRLSVGFNRDWCQVRVSTLLKRTGYRSDKTVRAALNGLVTKGLIERRSHHNNPLGDEYQLLNKQPSTQAKNSGTPVLRYSTSPVKSTAVLESKITGHLNTLLKDNLKIDDEKKFDSLADDSAKTDSPKNAASGKKESPNNESPVSLPKSDPLKPLTDQLRQAYLEHTGSHPQDEEARRFQELAQVLVDELKFAAAQTKGVTSPAAFLATHLKRRLTQKSDSNAQENRKSATTTATMMRDTVGQTVPAEPERGARIAPEARAEYVKGLSDLLAHGYSIEKATEQFAEGFHPDDWLLVKNEALAELQNTKNASSDSLNANSSDKN